MLQDWMMTMNLVKFNQDTALHIHFFNNILIKILVYTDKGI